MPEPLDLLDAALADARSLIARLEQVRLALGTPPPPTEPEPQGKRPEETPLLVKAVLRYEKAIRSAATRAAAEWGLPPPDLTRPLPRVIDDHRRMCLAAVHYLLTKPRGVPRWWLVPRIPLLRFPTNIQKEVAKQGAEWQARYARAFPADLVEPPLPCPTPPTKEEIERLAGQYGIEYESPQKKPLTHEQRYKVVAEAVQRSRLKEEGT